MKILKNLNDKQKEAIISESQYVRIIAGAGSGKTRVLTTRIAHLIQSMGVYPQRIIGFTFTNKAAEEMINRVKTILDDGEVLVRLSTFHAFGVRLLREDGHIVGLPSGFLIYDDEDTKTLIRNICVERGHEKRGEMSKAAINFIGNNKEKGLQAEAYVPRPHGHQHEKELVEIWREYERRLATMGCVDFSDLISKTIVILEKDEKTRDKWRGRFDHILVDEFQDTNAQQYKLIKLLLAPSSDLYVVGDPDQTIYTWRGAEEKIILNLDKDFKGVETIVLEENYRSTQYILNAANKLIEKNHNRLPKNLFTSLQKGEPVVVQKTGDPDQEAKWVYDQLVLMKLNVVGFSYDQVAILMRANYLTLPFEQLFLNEGIPYEIYGGLKFYQRAEVKDVLAYLRILASEKDDISFERVINTPRRNIGNVTLDKIRVAAKVNEFSLLETIRFVKDLPVSVGVQENLDALIYAIDETRQKIKEGRQSFAVIITDYITNVGYFNHIQNEKNPDKEETMTQNVYTLLANINEFQEKNPNETFTRYLENVALHSSQDDVKNGNYVTLMTVHMAKGLEYEYVFVIGLSQNVFPNNRAVTEAGHKGLEEERRLAYVAFTRAKKKLFLSYNTAYNFATSARGSESQFIGEAGLTPPRHKEYHARYGTPQRNNEGGKAKVPRAPTYGSFFDVDFNSDFPFAENDIVIHENLGSGLVLEAIAERAHIVVKFDNGETKTLKVPNKFIKKG